MPLLGRKPIALSLEFYRQVGMGVDIGTHINILWFDVMQMQCVVIIIGYYNLESNGGCKVNMVKPHKQEKRTSQIIPTQLFQHHHRAPARSLNRDPWLGKPHLYHCRHF
jgi:hypothetical protein